MPTIIMPLLLAAHLTCGLSTVGYRFIGEPGQAFEYGHRVYVIPKRGWIELIADGATTVRVGPRSIPLDVWPADEFSFRHVPLPKKAEK
jgi:hypothetical protein